ncbi:MAG: hypothetical protein FWG75_04610 [Cystobacterineae bacterium]|nr:hypothetical protein [Cystobacterineae bacterium]
MKRYFGIFLCLTAVLGAVVFAVKKWGEAKFEADKALSEIRLKADYLERVSWMRSMPSEVAYRSELGAFLQWYFAQTDAHIQAFNLNPQLDDYLKELSWAGSSIDRLEERKKVYEDVRSVFDLMQKGRYHPQWSASSQGVRLDVLSTRTVVEKGENKIRYQLVIWGLPRIRTEDRQLLRIHNRASFRAQWRMFDLKGKLIAEMRSVGDMAGRVDWPERYVSMFPADVTLGYYDVDLMPSNAETVEISFNIFSASLTGGDMRPAFVWKQTIPPEWRLRPGEVWEALPVEKLSSVQ